MTVQVSEIHNIPARFDRLVAAPAHRVFAVFDDPQAGMAAVSDLRSTLAMTAEDDVWVFFGDEGSRRLDVEGSGHGLRGAVIRTVQKVMSNDLDYLKVLDDAVRAGHLVVAVRVEGDAIDRAAAVLRAHSGRSMARVSHLDFVPVGMSGWL